MQNIKKRMEKNPVTKIVIESHQDPSDGTVSLSATVFDGYTDEKLLHLDWYYDFNKLMDDLNSKIATRI